MIDKLTRQWVRTKADEAAVSEGCHFDLARAERVRDFFFRFLRHSKGEWGGKPFELLPWQWDDLIAPLFGWVRPDGTRRFRRAFVEIPKKNGKSTLASGIGLYLLVGDNEPGAEVYSAAADREQAGIVHGEAIRMVDASPTLTKHLSINRSTYNISYPKTQSWYRALSAEAETKEGLNAHGLIIDELHAWHGRKLWDTLKYAGRARRQPLLFVITTAGDDLLSVCREQYDYAKLILDGTVIDTRYFAYIREADVSDDWTKPETWHKANPSLGQTIRLDDFAADVKEAEKTPTTQSSFKRYSLNLWATSTNPWLRPEHWSACAREYTEDTLEGETAYGGLDLASVRDLCSFVLCFPSPYRLLPYFWLPEDTVNDPDSPEQYRVWAKQGLLKVTPGNVADYEVIESDIAQIMERFQVKEYAYDPWNAEQFTQRLTEKSGVERVLFSQTISNYAEPTREFERLVLCQGIVHNNHPVLNWNAGNVSVRSDPNNNLRPVKPPAGDKRKIDGITAAIMALARAMRDEGGGDVAEVVWI